MVYLPSNGHIVTLESTRNIQNTTPNQCSQSKTLGAVLISNDMARNRHHGWCVSEDTQLLTATKTEPVRANPLGVTLDSNVIFAIAMFLSRLLLAFTWHYCYSSKITTTSQLTEPQHARCMIKKGIHSY